MGITPFQYRQMVERTGHNPLLDAKPVPDAVTDEIRDLHGPILKFFHDNAVPCVHTNPSKKSRATPGAPDFVFPWKGKTHWMECKDDEGALSPDQLAFARMLLNHGIVLSVVRSMSQFRDLLNHE